MILILLSAMHLRTKSAKEGAKARKKVQVVNFLEAEENEKWVNHYLRSLRGRALRERGHSSADESFHYQRLN